MNSVFHGKLIFRWPERTASLLMPGLFLAAIAIHALAFGLFQVTYPPATNLAPSPAQVTFLTPANPQSAAVLHWVEAQNPAATRKLLEVNPPGLGEIRYTPSYATAQTLPKIAEPLPETVVFPAAHEPLALIAPAPSKITAPLTEVHTTLLFSEALQPRDAEPKAPIPVDFPTTATSLQPSCFLIGLNDRGILRYSFLQSSCGDPQIDQQGERLLSQRRFTHGDAGRESAITWGFATFTWGREAFAPRPANATANGTQP